MSDERLRELERAAALRPSDPEAIDALIDERYRLGLRVAPELYEQRVFPPLSFPAPPKSRLEWARPGGRYRRPRYPAPSGDYELEAHESFTLELRRHGPELHDLPGLSFGPGAGRGLERLQSLELDGIQLRDDGGLHELPDLRHLKLTEDARLAEETLRGLLASSPRLTHLDLTGVFSYDLDALHSVAHGLDVKEEPT